MVKIDQAFDWDTAEAEAILERAYEMYPSKHEPSKYLAEGDSPFPMCSFERASIVFWISLIKNMFKRGMTDQEVEWLLRSKEMRWMFDELEDKVIDEFTNGLLTDSMVETAKLKAGGS